MRLLYDICIALLASYGIVALVWVIIGALSRRTGKTQSIHTVVKVGEPDDGTADD
jgi:hypothetical protein